MCGTCGCDAAKREKEHGHRHESSRSVRLEVDLLQKNDRLAARNRAWFEARSVLALNLMGAPGAGKTTLLEKTIHRLKEDVPVAVLEGDQETDRDAARIRATGCPVLQINTGAGCHLDAEMVAAGLDQVGVEASSLLVIENVGNLVCPAMFDLGEALKVLVMSVTEGEDKPVKYPHMFRAADVLLVNKIDLLPHVQLDLDTCLDAARSVNPRLRVFTLSSTREVGLDAWCDFLAGRVEVSRSRGPRADRTEVRR